MAKLNKTLTATAIAALFALSGPAFADHHGDDHGDDHGQAVKEAAQAHEGSVEETAKQHGEAMKAEKEAEKAEKGHDD